MLFFIYIIYNDDILAGGGSDGNYLKDILRYNKNHNWEEVGQMKEARAGHALAVLEDSNICP